MSIREIGISLHPIPVLVLNLAVPLPIAPGASDPRLTDSSSPYLLATLILDTLAIHQLFLLRLQPYEIYDTILNIVYKLSSNITLIWTTRGSYLRRISSDLNLTSSTCSILLALNELSDLNYLLTTYLDRLALDMINVLLFTSTCSR